MTSKENKKTFSTGGDSPAAAQKEKFQDSGVSFKKISLHPPKNLVSAIRHPPSAIR
jgi:hypothetical protein